MSSIPPATDPAAADRHVAALDFELAKLDVLERMRFQASFAQSAWQALSLVNGGAIVALFTFIGTAKPQVDQSRIWLGFICFAAGLILNILSIITAFVGQGVFMKATTSAAWNKQSEMHGYAPQHVEEQKRNLRRGNVWKAIALAACLLSLAAFVTGAGFSLAGVSVATLPAAR